MREESGEEEKEEEGRCCLCKPNWGGRGEAMRPWGKCGGGGGGGGTGSGCSEKKGG